MTDPDPREGLGRLVREVWVARARQHHDPKPSWLTGWDELGEWDQETDRAIGEAVARAVIAPYVNAITWNTSYLMDREKTDRMRDDILSYALGRILAIIGETGDRGDEKGRDDG